jgi:hypothetical protein
MSPPTSIALVSVCLQGLQPCLPSYASSSHDTCFGYVHVYVHEHVHVEITPSPTHSISRRATITIDIFSPTSDLHEFRRPSESSTDDHSKANMLTISESHEREPL